MNEDPSLRPTRVPVWFVILIIIAALPALGLPMLVMMSENPVQESKKIFLMLFPFYLIVASYLSWQCYHSGRTVMSWILLVIMLLTDVSMIILMSVD